MGRITEEDDGKIIKDENEEVIKVVRSSYKMLMANSGGWKYFILLNIAMSLLVYFKIQLDYTIGKWVILSEED